MKKTTLLKKMLNERRAVVAPGAYDALSAILIEKAGFELIQVSGFGLAASLLGKPDIGWLTATEMIDQTRRIVNCVDIPVMGDADTGFGNATNVWRTVRDFEDAGVGGINLEDQVYPKRCGHMEGKQLVSKEEMCLKIQAAADARRDKDLVINARTDAIAVEGYEAAIERSIAYVEAGADMIFLEAPRSTDQIRDAAKRIKAPLSINLFDSIVGGKTPLLKVEELKELGVARISVPVGVVFAAQKGVQNYLEVIKREGIAPGRMDLVVSFEEFKNTVGLPQIREIEKKYLPKAVLQDKYEKEVK